MWLLLLWACRADVEPPPGFVGRWWQLLDPPSELQGTPCAALIAPDVVSVDSEQCECTNLRWQALTGGRYRLHGLGVIEPVQLTPDHYRVTVTSFWLPNEAFDVVPCEW